MATQKQKTQKQVNSKSMITKNEDTEKITNFEEIKFQDDSSIIIKSEIQCVKSDPKLWLQQYLFSGNQQTKSQLKENYQLKLGVIEEVVAKPEEIYEKRTQQTQQEIDNNNTNTKSDNEDKNINKNDNDSKQKKEVTKRSFLPEAIRQGYEDAKDNYHLDFLIKTNDEARNYYLQKLISNKILKTEPTKKEQSILIFDWDDTLLCTTYLGSLGFTDLEQEIIDLIIPLDESVKKLLTKAIDYGEVYIITNAADGWVEYSSKYFLPKAHEILIQNKIKIISARGGYEDKYPGDTTKWKNEAFLKLKDSFDKTIITNLLCFGDSHIEIDAAHSLAAQFNQALIKTIKFRENPRPDELVKQQNLLSDKLDQIFMSTRNLTIRLEKKQSGSQANSQKG